MECVQIPKSPLDSKRVSAHNVRAGAIDPQANFAMYDSIRWEVAK